MSIYRKDKYGNLFRTAGAVVQRWNDRIFTTTHTTNGPVDYYTIDNTANKYITGITPYTEFTLFLDVPNTSSEVYVKYQGQTLRVFQSNGDPITPGMLANKISFYTLDEPNSKIWVDSSLDLTKSQVKILYEANPNTNVFTDDERDKLAYLESSKFVGQYPEKELLEEFHPTAPAGSYAYVDKGPGFDVQKYIWDTTDNKWVFVGAVTSDLTSAQVKQLYESNEDTNEFTNAEKADVSKIPHLENDLSAMEAGYTYLLNEKVDKVSGKSLSTEDYTTEEKNKLSGIEAGAEKNVQSDWEQTDNTKDDFIKNKPDVVVSETLVYEGKEQYYVEIGKSYKTHAAGDIVIFGWYPSKSSGLVSSLKENVLTGEVIKIKDIQVIPFESISATYTINGLEKTFTDELGESTAYLVFQSPTYGEETMRIYEITSGAETPSGTLENPLEFEMESGSNYFDGSLPLKLKAGDGISFKGDNTPASAIEIRSTGVLHNPITLLHNDETVAKYFDGSEPLIIKAGPNIDFSAKSISGGTHILEIESISPELDPYQVYASQIYYNLRKSSLFNNAWADMKTVNNVNKDEYPNADTNGIIIPYGTIIILRDTFQDLLTNNQPLVIPNSVTSIGVYAFNNWIANNQPLIIPDSLTSIGGAVFRNWQANNQPLVIPNSVTSIGASAFRDWQANNQPLVIPNSVTSIDNYAFQSWIANNQPLVIPNSVTNIGSQAFQDWIANNQPLIIPDSVTSIGNYAFQEWSKAHSFEMRRSIPPTIGADTFYKSNNAPIYVPDANVDDYKTATNWVIYADRIFPVSEKEV